MQIVDITEFYSDRGGGVRTHLDQKLRAAEREGVKLSIVAPGARDEQITVGHSRIYRFAGPSLPYDPAYHLLYRIDRIQALIKELKPEVVEVHSPYLAAAAAITLARKHFGIRVLTWHSDFIDTYIRVWLAKKSRDSIAKRGVQPLWAGVRALTRRFDATFVASRYQEQKLRGHGIANVQRLPFGFERDLFSPSKASPEIRQRWLAHPERDRSGYSLLVAVGRLGVEKRVDIVIQAFLKLRPQRPAVLLIFGAGPERERLEALAGGCEDIIFAGFTAKREELAATLASADLLLHGCPYETFGLSIAEALASGLPVVVPDRGGAAELGNSACSRHYPALDPEAAARAALDLLDQPRAQSQAAARHSTQDLPTIDEAFAARFRRYRESLR